MPINDPWQYFLDREKQKEDERQKYGRVISPERPNLWDAPTGNDLPPEGEITGNQPRSPATFFPDNAPDQQQQSNQARPNLSGYPEDPYAGAVSQSEDRLQSLSNPYSPNFVPIVNQDHGWKGRMKDILRESLYNFGQEWRANAGMPGDQRLAAAGGAALGGGLAGGFNPTLNEQRDRLRDIGWERARLGDLQNSALRTAQTQNIYADNARLDQQARDLSDYRQGTIKERDLNRQSRDANVKMRMAEQMWKTIPSYDPNDPKFAQLTKMLGDVQLPLTPKDAKKNVKQVQDAETGAWSLILTDPITGQQEVRPVTDKSGSQLVTTSTAKVAADAAAGRQESQQTFTLKRDQIAQQLRKEMDDYQTANREMLAEKDQTRKLEMQNAIEQRQKHIKQLQMDLTNELGSSNQ